jgi:hypothetical protein
VIRTPGYQPDLYTRRYKVVANGTVLDLSYIHVTLAHEVLHACNVLHHGDGDKGRVQWTAGPGGTVIEGGTNVTVMNEKGQDVTARVSADLTNKKLNDQVYVSVWGGEHSGSEDCVMRYDSAKAWIPRSAPNVRNWINPPGEKVGLSLCSTQTANGNAAKRYGNATRGNCKQTFCVNDKYH